MNTSINGYMLKMDENLHHSSLLFYFIHLWRFTFSENLSDINNFYLCSFVKVSLMHFELGISWN